MCAFHQLPLKQKEGRIRWSISLLILFFSFFLLCFLGNDSPLLMPYDHVDSSWFFMGGKALMNGLTPYKDFTDSKGPLLWLLYGIGYLLSPTNFNGIFYMGILLYWGVFLIVYKIAYQLLGCSRKAFSVTLLSPIFFFMPVIHGEIRAEDYNQIFNAAILFSIIKLMLKDGSRQKYGLIIGICLGGSLLLKYNFTILSAIPACILTVYEFTRSFQKGIQLCCFMAIGFLLMVSPFVFFLLFKGAFGDFIREYFINTYLTIKSYDGNYDMLGLQRLKQCFKMVVIDHTPLSIILKIFCLAVVFMPIRIYKSNWLRVTMICWFIGSVVVNLSVPNEYYLSYLAIFGVVGLISLISYLPPIRKSFSLMVSGVAILLILLIELHVRDGHFYFVETAIANQDVDKKIKTIKETFLREKEHPTIAFLGCMDRGEHVAINGLPGMKYWAKQNGSTPEMERRNREDVFRSHPDIVILPLELDELYGKKLIDAGYRLALEYHHILIPQNEPSERKLYVKRI